MTTLDEHQQKNTFRLCAFGRAKVGKTALIAQLARKWRLHWIDLEDGLKTALNPEILPKEFWKNIQVFPIASTQKNPMGAETLLKLVVGKECIICYKHGKVSCPQATCKPELPGAVNKINLNEFTTDDWLVIDSTTQLSTDVSFATNAVIRNAENPEDFVLDRTTGGKDFKFPMANSFILDKIFGTLQASKINVAVISHEVMTERTKDTGHIVGAGQNQPSDNVEMLFPAAGSRNFSRNFGRYFDMLIHVDVVNKKHRAFSSSVYSGTVQTGSRLPFNIEEIKNGKGEILPPFEAIVKMIEQAKGLAQ